MIGETIQFTSHDKSTKCQLTWLQIELGYTPQVCCKRFVSPPRGVLSQCLDHVMMFSQQNIKLMTFNVTSLNSMNWIVRLHWIEFLCVKVNSRLRLLMWWANSIQFFAWRQKCNSIQFNSAQYFQQFSSVLSKSGP